MSPGLRLLLVPVAALAGALACYALPPRARRRSLAVALIAAATSTVLLVSVVSGTGGGAVVQRDFPTLVQGVPLSFRGDSTGVGLSLVAAAASLTVLLGRERRPVECAGLLLCLAGTLVACLGGTVYLLVAGLEVGNVGALLMAVGGTRDVRQLRRAKIGFAIHHLASLGLLAGAVQLTTSVGTATFAALPPGAIGVFTAGPWALVGALRLVAAAALAAETRERVSGSWLAVAAVPSGLVTLLRLGGAAQGGVPTQVALALGGFGLAAAVVGAGVAISSPDRPAVAGRALLVALGGQIVAAVAVGSSAALTAATALGIGLVLAAIAAPAWEPGRLSVGRRRLATVALLGAGGLPVGTATTGLLAATGAEAAAGMPRSLVALVAGAAAVLAAVAAGRTVAALLERPAVAAATPPVRASVRVDVAAALLVSAALGLLPGAVLGGLADRVSDGQGALVAVDPGAVHGPGFGWSGGYLGGAALLAVAAAWAVSVVLGTSWRTAVEPGSIRTDARRRATSGGRPSGRGARSRVPARAVPAWAWVSRTLTTVDGWLVTQPSLLVIVLAAAAALAWFQVRR